MVKAAIELFMSAAPRPYRKPLRSVGSKGSVSHCSSGPVGTTSVWPAKTTQGDSEPLRNQRLVTSSNTSVSLLNPALAKRSDSKGWQPASSGVTDGRAISALVNSSTED